MTLLGLRLGNVQYGPAGHLNRNLRFHVEMSCCQVDESRLRSPQIETSSMN